MKTLRHRASTALLALAIPSLIGLVGAAEPDPELLDSPEDPELGTVAPRYSKIGLTSVSGSIDVLTMIGFGGSGVSPSSGVDFTLRLDRPLLPKALNETFDFHVRMRYRRSIGNTSPSALGDQMGTVWGVVDGFTNGGYEIPEMFFRQRLPQRNLELRYGQMVMDSQFDTQSIGGSKSAFLNRALSASPTVAFPRLGAGFTAFWDPDGPWEFLLGITTVQGTATGSQIDFEFGSSDFFKALQVDYVFNETDPGPKRIQLLLWSSDPVEDALLEEGSGFSLTYNHRFGRSNTDAYARFAWASGGATDARALLVGGIASEIRPGGRLGFGAGIGRGTSPGYWQAVAETFYRWDIGNHGSLNANLQILGGEGFTDGGSLRCIFGLGCRFFF